MHSLHTLTALLIDFPLVDRPLDTCVHYMSELQTLRFKIDFWPWLVFVCVSFVCVIVVVFLSVVFLHRKMRLPCHVMYD